MQQLCPGWYGDAGRQQSPATDAAERHVTSSSKRSAYRADRRDGAMGQHRVGDRLFRSCVLPVEWAF